MTDRPNPPIELKPTWCWVVVDPWGSPLLRTVHDLRRDAIQAALDIWRDDPWKRIYREGYRCVHVLIAFPGAWAASR